ncbi:choice-of-anchor K domain-containing protein [Prosthecobacter vanneervenii]|uniref:Uncharacterized protein n=1 Tax=Prosthecobacter vanneervenii TaxID=48466 RepID=A0A7W7Y7P1_9BACT|nr:choice-of-anchor K domain-containing protein [Prosthecobacter vanneervenii]MBB5031147.1 hypothetical protein [Prosthecobacter vanneervenii]
MIAILGVITGILVNSMGGDVGGSNAGKLQADVAGINHMIALYLADGGSLAGLSSPQAIIDKMKRSRPQSEWQQHAGMVSGKLLDVRLQARMTTTSDPAGAQRALWDRTKQRFYIGTSGSGVKEFYLDNALASADYGTETRTKSLYAFNSGKTGWVWSNPGTPGTPNYMDPTATTPVTPASGFDPNETAPASSTPPTDSGGGSGGGDGGSGGGPGSQPTLAMLTTPIFTPSGGTFAFGSFPSTVAIVGAGPAGASLLMYSINGGSWQTYTGPIPLTPAMNIQAQNVSTRTAEFANSNVNSQTYYRLISGFTGTDTGSWGNAKGGPNLVTNTQNTDTTSTFKSGNTKLDLGGGQYLDAGMQNSISFTPAGFNNIAPNTWFDFGAMQLANGTTFYNSEATAVTLTVNLNLSQPAVSYTAYINLGLVSTPNTSDPLSSADVVQLLNPTTDFTITIDGVQYRLELQWQSLDPSSSVVQGNNLLIFEGATAAVELRARFTSNF